MFTKPPLRVSRLIAQETERAITINRLAELIKKANEEAGTNCSVSRKMLRLISRPADRCCFSSSGSRSSPRTSTVPLG
ncbi:MAG: hypothetical protein AAB676_02590 [Verrucomicrobiota bacterium]